jgi:hypothetical protein
MVGAQEVGFMHGLTGQTLQILCLSAMLASSGGRR